jgi:UDP-3-O-[3-hydroxymyristoyl] glucosamine N-acyltransferase
VTQALDRGVQMTITIIELAKQLGAAVAGAPAGLDHPIAGIEPIEAAGEDNVTFVTNAKHVAAVGGSRAALIQTLNLFAPKLKPVAEGVDSTAKIGSGVQLAAGVGIGPFAVISDGVQIGCNTIIAAGCRIGQGTRIGSDCRLDANVVVYHGCVLGDHVVIQANSTIGSVGFGYAFIDGSHRLIPHNGGVILEDFVEIGANCCVDRAKFGNTIVGAGTKIDNLVQIAHNVVIGKCCLIASQAGVAGSCRLGDGVVLAGQVGLADNIEVGAGTMIGAQAGVMNNVGPGEKLAWSPAIDVKEALRVVGHVLRLPKLSQEVKRLTAKVDKLEAAKNDKG